VRGLYLQPGLVVRHLKTLLLAVGALAVGALVYYIGAGAIAQTLERVRWWQFVLICLPYALITAADALGWHYAFAQSAAPFWRLYGAKLAGEALNVVTAVGSVGGEAVKAWLIRRDVGYETSVPSVIIAKTTITIAQTIFLAIGVVIVGVALPVRVDMTTAMYAMLVVEIVCVGIFTGAQAAGLIGRMGQLLARVGLVAAPEYAAQLDTALRDYYRREPRRLSLSVGFHTVGWLLGAVEAFIILWTLEVPANLLAATVVEAFGSGVRFATFFVPASLGAFEGANAGAFGALGYGAPAGLAFSLIRRARQLVWIVIGLVVLVFMRVANARAQARADASVTRTA
jgi:glycosyltransferase 2 family protein